MLDVIGISKMNKLYAFLKWLELWAQIELRTQRMKDLFSTLAIPDALLDLWVCRVEVGNKKS